eukprot:jgi/Ulvmu1/10954/UM007_0133.1
MPARRGRPHAGRGGDALLWALVARLIHEISQLEQKPPVTLTLMAVQVAIFILPTIPMRGMPDELRELVMWIPSVRQGCLKPASVIEAGQWSRLLWSALLHADEWHLYYNMSSFLWKGLQLEPALGPVRFAALLCELLLSCQAIYVGLFWAVRAALGPTSPLAAQGYSYTCAVGFSGVLFALKAVLMSGTAAWQHVSVPLVGHVPLPPKYAAWAELLIIQMVMPNVSFTGHLCGILAGLVHVHVTRRLVPSMRPAAAAPSPPPPRQRRRGGWWGGGRGGLGGFGGFFRQPRFWGHGTAGGDPRGPGHGSGYARY